MPRGDDVRLDHQNLPVMRARRELRSGLVLCALSLASCSEAADPMSPAADAGSKIEWSCEAPAGDAAPDYLDKIGCRADFDALSSLPLDASIPGARSGKVIMDLFDEDRLYFQNSRTFPIHYEFARAHLNEPSDPQRTIGSIGDFNPQYTLPELQRRFLLGAVSYYEGPKAWVLEVAPYDTSTPAMIRKLFEAVRDHAYFGSRLHFHPTSENVQARADDLPASVPVLTTDELYQGIDYQPLNLGEALGPIRFVRSVDLDRSYVTTRDIVVLDAVPNDIAPVNGLLTEDFQTPLSHINVLARNRGTPNMGLRDAWTVLKAQGIEDGQHVRLTVGKFDYQVEPVSTEESEAWWNEHRPPPVDVLDPDLSVTELRDIAQVTAHTDTFPFAELADIQTATAIFGAKAANYSVFATDPRIPNKKAFAIPVFYYDQYMRENGFYARVDELRRDPAFNNDAAVREAALAELRGQIMTTDLNESFRSALEAKLDADFPGLSMRYRSSTNAEDLSSFPCAGCYDSHTGDPADFPDAGENAQIVAASRAIRRTWATVWNLRTYDERELHQIAHTDVAMALLVHTNFPTEEANGVAITNNIFDQSGNTPGFYVNVQTGGTYEVVHPPPGVSSDSLLILHSFPNKPIIYYTHSNVTEPEGAHVLTDAQAYALADALEVVNDRFRHAFGTKDGSWWAMDCEFKFDDEADPGADPALYIKQARPYPRGQTE